MSDNAIGSNSNPINNFSNLALEGDKGAEGRDGDQNSEQKYHYALTKRDLYGGAMMISIPSKWRDVSDVRQVPDHQEVYQDCTFAAPNDHGREMKIVQEGTGGCLVIEILERQNEVSDDEASSFFFRDLADENQSDNIRGENSRDAASPSIEYSNTWTVGMKGNGNDAKGEREKEVKEKEANLMPKLSAEAKACSCVGIQTVGPMKNRAELEAGKASQIRVELCVVRLEVVQTDLVISLSMPLFPAEMKMGGVLNRKKKNKGHSELFKCILESFEVVDWSLFA